MLIVRKYNVQVEIHTINQSYVEPITTDTIYVLYVMLSKQIGKNAWTLIIYLNSIIRYYSNCLNI